MTDDELRAGLERAGFGGLVERAIAKTRSEVWITTTRTDAFTLGQSRIGGAPDLPRGTPWPRHRWTRAETASWPEWSQQELAQAIEQGTVIEEDDRIALALPFVAQLDCAELAPFQSVLPRIGQLWVFAEQHFQMKLVLEPHQWP